VVDERLHGGQEVVKTVVDIVEKPLE